MLQDHAQDGTVEVACPACREDPGWEDRDALRPCRLCCAFRFVPVGLSLWYRGLQVQSAESANRTFERRFGDGGA